MKHILNNGIEFGSDKLLLILMVFGFGLQAAMLPVCERTEAVKKFLELDRKKTCDQITEADLELVLRVAVPNKNITVLKAGDFSGLPNLETLNIKGNPYTELPEGLFAGLPKLKTIVIFGTKLMNLPADFLEGHPDLENLHIFRNPFKTISESVFVRLEAMKRLKALDFTDTLNPAEKARLLKAFPAGGPVFLDFL